MDIAAAERVHHASHLGPELLNISSNGLLNRQRRPSVMT
jgi:hypothetical protein